MIDLKRIRKKLELTQTEFANIFGVDASFVSKIEKGRRKMPKGWKSVLKEKFNVIADEYKMVQNFALINQRIQLLFADKGIEKYSTFAMLTGLSHQTASNYLKGERNPSNAGLNKILTAFPEINPRWLLSGEGEKYLENEILSIGLKERIKLFVKDYGITTRKFEESIGASNGYVNSIKKGIGGSYLLEIGRIYPNLNLNWLENGSGKMYLEDVVPEKFETKNNEFYSLNNLTVMAVPLVSMHAHAQYVDEFYNEASDITFEYIRLEVDQYGKGHYLAFRIEGDSMNGGMLEDTPDNAIVLAREIGQHLWSSGLRKSKYGHIIVTNRNILFKDIINFDREKGIITCHSRNKSPEYSDFELPLGDRDEECYVLQIFKVTKRSNM